MKALFQRASALAIIATLVACPTPPPPGDTIIPEISIVGHAHITTEQFATYVDAGVVAMDDQDGDISASVVTTGAMDTSTIGVYELTFTATDMAGNSASTTRIVEVIPVGAVVFEEGVNSYQGFRDASLFQLRPENSGGGQDAIFAGRIRTGEFIHGLIEVDLSSLANPVQVTGAELSLTVDLSGANSLEGTYELHVVAKDWGEGTVLSTTTLGGFGEPADPGDATWTHSFFATESWDTPGGDFAELPSASAGAGQHLDVVTWSSAQLAADVQAWIDDPSRNFGWAIVPEVDSANQRAQRYYSSESSVHRPRLTVFTSPN